MKSREEHVGVLGRLLGIGYKPKNAAPLSEKRIAVRCVEEWAESERSRAHIRVRNLRLAVARGHPPSPDELTLHTNWLLAYRLKRIHRKVQLNAAICGLGFNAVVFSFFFKKHFLWVKNTFFIASTLLIQWWASANAVNRCYDGALGIYLFNKMGHLAQAAEERLLLQKVAPQLAFA